MKRLLSVFFILLMCLSFAACTSEGTEGAQTSGQEETSLGDVSSTNEENIYKEINQGFQQLFSEARSKAEKLCAAYTITYEYETGTKSVERVVFVQGEVE